MINHDKKEWTSSHIDEGTIPNNFREMHSGVLSIIYHPKKNPVEEKVISTYLYISLMMTWSHDDMVTWWQWSDDNNGHMMTVSQKICKNSGRFTTLPAYGTYQIFIFIFSFHTLIWASLFTWFSKVFFYTIQQIFVERMEVLSYLWALLTYHLWTSCKPLA